MSENSRIEWTDATWTVTAGCTPVSRGCANCYAAAMTRRLARIATTAGDYGNLATDRHFNGTVRLLPGNLGKPLHWRKSRRIFVDSMSDLFHPDVPFEFISQVFQVMMTGRHHTYQILTKRPERMAEYLAWTVWRAKYEDHPQIWLGTSVENQTAAIRTNYLRQCPAVVRFVSVEPLIGPVRLLLDGIHWIIAGGESGVHCRPCNFDWLRSLRDQCAGAGIPFFCKQLGGNPHGAWEHGEPPKYHLTHTNGHTEICENRCKNGRWRLRDRKGGWMDEWPEDLRIREFPKSL